MASPPVQKDPTAGALEKFRYVPSFGERFSSIQTPRIYKISLDRTSPPVCRILVHPHALDGIVFAQPVFVPHSRYEDIIVTGYGLTASGFRLGLYACTNRPSAIYRLSWPSGPKEDISIERLSKEGRSARSPRVLHLKDKRETLLVYLSNALEGPHDSCASLHVLPLSFSPSSPAPDVLVDVVREPADPDAFPGLYVSQLPRSPFLFPGSNRQPHILLTSLWGPRRVPLLIDLSSGAIEKVDPLGRDETESWTVLATDGDHTAVLTGSGLEGSVKLVLGNFEARHTASIQLYSSGGDCKFISGGRLHSARWFLIIYGDSECFTTCVFYDDASS
jgi:acylaminoacyl-peptidase